jgi:phosphate transport system substrate-binding protein
MNRASIVLWLWLAACGPGPAPVLSGELRIEGSTTIAPIIQTLLPRVEPRFPDLHVTLTVDGSGKGIVAAGEGKADLGLSSRPLKASDLASYPELASAAIALDGLSVIVDGTNSVRSLTLAQVQQVFAGDVTNWGSLGGPDLAITVVTRTSDTGTGTFFHDSVMGGRAYAASHLEFVQSTDLEAKVASTPGAVGYAGLAFTTGNVHVLALDSFGIVTSPSAATVRSGRYPLSRELLVITRGPPAGLARDFFDLLISEVGQRAVTDTNYVPIR